MDFIQLKSRNLKPTSQRLSLASRSALCIAFLLCAAASAFAQNTSDTLTGRITDRNGAGVPSASVTLYDRARPAARFATVTDEQGNYRFPNLARGEYIIEVEADGFARTASSIAQFDGILSNAFDVTLELSGVREEVVVTAASTPQTVDEISKAVNVISNAEIEARDEFSIADAIRTVPGVRVAQLGFGVGRQTAIRTRGLRAEDTAVLIDGFRFRDPSAPQADATAFVSDFTVTNLNQVEVLRGSGSSLYGTNAIGGTVNIITDEGGGATRGAVFSEGGNLGFYRGGARIAGGLGTADKVIYSLGVSHLNVARGIDGNDASRNTSGQGRVLFNLTPTANISARIYTGDTFTQLNSSPELLNVIPRPADGIFPAIAFNGNNTGTATFIPDADDADSRQASRFFAGLVTFANRPKENFGYQISYQGLATRRTLRNGASEFGFDGTIQTLSARTDFRIGRFNFINAGYEFENENFTNDTLTGNMLDLNARATQRSNTIFIQDQMRFFENRLQLSAAFRAQFFSLKTPRFTPSASSPFQDLSFVSPPDAYTGDGSIAYLIRSSNTKLRAHIGNGYRSPSLFERFGAFSFFGLTATGDPRLRPERSIAFDIGIDQTAFDNRVRASATFFYTRLQEVIEFAGSINTATDPFGRFFGYRNTGGGLARGVELSASVAPTNTTDIFASYTFTNSDDRFPKFGNIIRRYVIPSHQFSLVATQRFGQRTLVNFDFVTASSYLSPVFQSVSPFGSAVLRFDGITKADLGASYTLPINEKRAVRFFGKVDNLTDRDNFENGFRNAGRTARGGAAFTF